MVFLRQDDEKYVKWARAVKVRDDFACQICGRQNVELHSHHIRSWDIHVDERYNIHNGVTLCTRCHIKFHSVYGKGKNNEIQFSEFRDSMLTIMSIVKKGKLE